LSFIYLLIC